MKSVLIIEHDPALKRSLLRLLGRYGWWVDAVESLEEALVFLDRTPPDVVLIDWQIAGGSGLALLLPIKERPDWCAVPVVMLHHGVAVDEIEEALAMGANDFLPVPFTADGVRRTLDRWVIERSDIPKRKMTR